MEAKEWFSVGAYLQVEGVIPSAWWSVSQSYSGLFFKSSHKVVQDFFVVAAVPLWLHIEVAVADICWWQAEHKYFIFFITLHNIFCSRCQANCVDFAASTTALVLKIPCRKLYQHSINSWLAGTSNNLENCIYQWLFYLPALRQDREHFSLLFRCIHSITAF